MQPLVVVVIVVWNGITDTLECLRSLAGDKYPNKHILVVDNGSTDGSVERIRAEGFQVSVIHCPINLGFTGGNNVGLAEARRRGAKYAFLLNNDTTLHPDALTNVVFAAEARPVAGLLSPVVHYYDAPAEVWFAGATLSLPRGEAVHCSLPAHRQRVRHSGEDTQNASTFLSDWLSGCAMLVRIEALATVGGFDDRFFLTWEDVDWCVRMRLSRWEVVVVPNACIYHKCGRSGARMAAVHRYYAVRNSLLLAAKHAGPFYLSAFFWIMCRHFRGALRKGQTEKKENVFTVFEGLKDHLLGRYGRRPAAHGNGRGGCPAVLRETTQAEEEVCVSSR